MPVQLQQWRARDWEDDGCSQENQTGACIMARFGPETYAIGHEMSNHPSEKQRLANTTQRWIACRTLVATYKIVALLFCTPQSLLTTVLDHGRW